MATSDKPRRQESENYNAIWHMAQARGQVGAADQRVSRVAPSREKFVRNIAAAGVTDMVELIEQYSTQVAWNRPIGLQSSASVGHGAEKRNGEHYEN